MIYDKRSYENMKYIEDALQSPITGIKTDDFEAMEKVGRNLGCDGLEADLLYINRR